MQKYMLLLFFCTIFFFKQIFAQNNKKDITIPICTVIFSHNKDRVDEKLLNSCIAKIDLKNLVYIDIFTTSTPAGGLTYNHYLSERRGKNIEKLLKRFNVPINLRNGGSSQIFGRQGTITFLTHEPKEKPIACPTPAATTEIHNAVEPQQISVKQEEIPQKNKIEPYNDLYFGAGPTFISSPLSDYTGSTMMTYNIGINHKLIPFTLFGEQANFYIGADISFTNSQRTLPQKTSGNTVLSQESDVIYVRNNYAFIFAIERNFSFAKSLATFLEIGPALQERVFILSVTTGPTQNGYAAKKLGLISNFGFKYKFLNQTSLLKNIGIENLFLRLSINASYGYKMDTDPLTYKPATEIVNINNFSWGTILSIGASY